jgi:natural product precursor
MKKLAKLKLSVLNEQNLEDKYMNALRGGNCFVRVIGLDKADPLHRIIEMQMQFLQI